MSDLNHKTILLVEDEAFIALTEKTALEKYGYQVIIALTGEKAVEIFQNTPGIDLILMDINLGNGIDGTDTAQLILKDHNVPVVFLSSHTEPEVVEKTEAITSYGYVVKNSGITVLIASIKMAFKLFAANRKIIESEIKENTMISNISDIIGIVGADGILKYKSPNVEKRFGWRPEDLVGKDIWSNVHPDDLEKVQIDFNALLQEDRSSKTDEYRYKCKDGTYKMIELTAINLTSDPIISGVLFNYHDITERKKIEGALLESELRYRSLFNGMTEGFALHDIVFDADNKPYDYRFLSVNPAFEKLTGLRSDDLIGKTQRQVMPDEDPFWFQTYSKVALTGESLYLEHYSPVLKLYFGVFAYCPALNYFAVIFSDITKRKQAESLLHERNKFLENIARVSPEIVYLYNTSQQRHIYINKELGDLLSYTNEVIMDRGAEVLMSSIHPEDIPRIQNHIMLISNTEGNEPHHIEYRIKGKNGEYLWLSVHEQVYQRGPDNSPEVLFGIAQVVTERKKVEKELQLNESRLRKLVDIMQHQASTLQEFLDYALEQTIMQTDSKFGYIYFYDEDSQQFILNTWSKDVMEACSIAHPLTSYDLDKTGIWGEAVRQRKPIVVNDFETFNPLKKGYPEGHVKLLRFMTIPVFNENRIVGVVGLANKESDYQDSDILQVTLLMEAVWKVTERMKAEQALRNSEERLKRALNAAKAGTWEWDLQTNENFWSDELWKLYELDPKTTKPEYKAWLEAIHPDDREQAQLTVGKAAENGTEIYAEWRVNTSDGHERWLMSRGKPVKDESGKIYLYRGVVIDITERKRTEKALRDSEERLVSLNSGLEERVDRAVREIREKDHLLIIQSRQAALGEMIGNIAHQWRQPLNMLALVLQNITFKFEYGGLNAELMQHYQTEGLKTIEYMSQTIDDFRNYFKPEKEKKMFSVEQVIRNTYKLVEEDLKNDNVQLNIIIEKTSAILGYSNEFGQVLLNLIHNSKDAFLEKGVKNPIINITVTMDDTATYVKVADNAQGIPETILDKIFDPYFTTKKTGTGIGLYMSRMLIENQMGGKLTVQNTAEGAEFTIKLLNTAP